MHYSWQLLLGPLLLSPFSPNARLVSAGRIPHEIRQSLNPGTIEQCAKEVRSESINPHDTNLRQEVKRPILPGVLGDLDDVVSRIRLLELEETSALDNVLEQAVDGIGGIGGLISTPISSENAQPLTALQPAPLPSITENAKFGVNNATKQVLEASSPSTNSTASASFPIDTAVFEKARSESCIEPTIAAAIAEAQSTATAETWPATTPSGVVRSGTLETPIPSVANITSNSSMNGTLLAQNISTSGYVFNAKSSNNVVVYYGQTPVTASSSVEAQCADPNIDIVILAFVISAADGGSYPGINFGAACGGQTPEMVAQAPGLLSCPALAANISSCQSNYGKKVLLSVGGATSQISFPSSSDASSLADMLWNLFGPPGNIDAGLRPFGDVEVDGFDVDNEDNLPSNYDVFGSTLRNHYPSANKTYYLTAAPQCPFPDASNPSGLLQLCDFVWVQFYNNPSCEIGSTQFAASVQQWSQSLLNSSLATKPMLYVGAPAFSAAGPTAYTSIGTAQGMDSVASTVEKMNLSNFGGMMFWDGPEGEANTAGGKDVFAWAKEGLMSR